MNSSVDTTASTVTDFFRFPHTPHLAWLGEGSPRDDKVLLPNEVAALLADCLLYTSDAADE